MPAPGALLVGSARAALATCKALTSAALPRMQVWLMPDQRGHKPQYGSSR